MDTAQKDRRALAPTSGSRLRGWLVPLVRPADLARQAGVSRQFVHKVLNGERAPSPRILAACRELGVPVDHIFETNTEKGKE